MYSTAPTTFCFSFCPLINQKIEFFYPIYSGIKDSRTNQLGSCFGRKTHFILLIKSSIEMVIQGQLHSENVEFDMEGCSQDYMNNNAFGFNDICFNFNLQQQQKQQQFLQHQQLQNLQQRNQNLGFQNSGLSVSIAEQIEKQRQEIDGFICIQNERLRWVLLEQRKQQFAMILKKLESKSQVLLRQKDEEIAKALNTRMELENLIRGMEIESQAWQRVAKENESIVLSLNNTIKELRESARFSASGIEDAESCCDMIEDRENRGEMMSCKSCNSGNSCIIFLPCRHLCSCKTCEAFLDSCPICKMAKKAIMEALL